jgi:hypothetical protein
MSAWVTISASILVFEKNGLKRGPGLSNAYFELFPDVQDDPAMTFINWTGGAPLAGTSNLYQVRIQSYRRDYFAPGGPGAGAPCHLRVGASRHYSQNFYVYNGDSFEVRLDRM